MSPVEWQSVAWLQLATHELEYVTPFEQITGAYTSGQIQFPPPNRACAGVKRLETPITKTETTAVPMTVFMARRIMICSFRKGPISAGRFKRKSYTRSGARDTPPLIEDILLFLIKAVSGELCKK